MKQIYTDGACSGNPGFGGWAAIIVEDNKVIDVRSGYFNNTTNNRMELTAIIWALAEYGVGNAWLKEDITIYSDSAYCVNMYNDWIDNWEKNNWTRSGNKPIENLDLVKKLYTWKCYSCDIDTRKGHTNDKIKLIPTIKVEKISGHSGIKYNELADKLATRQITAEEVLKQYGR